MGSLVCFLAASILAAAPLFANPEITLDLPGGASKTTRRSR